MNPIIISSSEFGEVIDGISINELLDNKDLPLLWYGKVWYSLGVVDDYEYYYMLTDQNAAYYNYNYGTPTKTPGNLLEMSKLKDYIPKSFLLFIRRKV